jgi:hypothetical protein
MKTKHDRRHEFGPGGPKHGQKPGAAAPSRSDLRKAPGDLFTRIQNWGGVKTVNLDGGTLVVKVKPDRLDDVSRKFFRDSATGRFRDIPVRFEGAGCSAEKAPRDDERPEELQAA